MGGKFAIILWGGVDEPAGAVAIDIEGEGAGIGAIGGVVSGDGGFASATLRERRVVRWGDRRSLV